MTAVVRRRRKKEHARRCALVNQAEGLYRSMLATLVGFGDFANIDARATDGKIPLHQAAREWAEGALEE